MSDPAEVKRLIAIEAQGMMLKFRSNKIKYDTVCRVIEARCREGARHNGVPEAWREYMPNDILTR